MVQHSKWLAWLLTALLCGNAAAQDGQVTARGGPVVTTVRVGQQQVQSDIVLVGILKANRQIAIAPQVSARVTRVHFVSGQQVEEGDLLLSLDDRESQAQVKEQQAALLDARRILANYQNLYQRKAVTQTELEGQQAAVAMAEAKLQASQVQADYLRLRAPFAGVVGLTDVAPGALLEANSPVAELLDIATLKLDLAVPEKYFRQLAVGTQLTAHAEAYGEQTFVGRLTVVSPSVDPDTLNARVRLIFDNGDRRLVPGMLMRVRLPLNNGTQTVVPAESLLYAGTQRYVFVVGGDGQVSRREVTTGANLGDWVTVESGLSPGERVVSEGVVKVRDGMRVEVKGEDL